MTNNPPPREPDGGVTDESESEDTMTIFQHTIDKVLDGSKTDTRRIVKPGEWFYFEGATIQGGQHRVYAGETMRDGKAVMPRKVYEVGRDYAAQPGRGKPSYARILLTNIRREDVRQISDADVKAEGFVHPARFFSTWCGMHDKFVERCVTDHCMRGDLSYDDAAAWYRQLMADRPAAFYDCWSLSFRVVSVTAAGLAYARECGIVLPAAV